jgi:hypothetical protein
MSAIRVTPVAGARVRNPSRDFAVLPAAGDTVPDSLFWRRREIAGEVAITDPAAEPAPSPSESATDTDENPSS